MELQPAKRRRGRPRVAVERKPVSVRLLAPEHDRLLKLAERHDMTLTELIRRGIRRELAYLQKPQPQDSSLH